MNWLDDYIRKNDSGYLMNEAGGLYVSINKEWVRHVKGVCDTDNLKEIPKSEFINLLLGGKE